MRPALRKFFMYKLGNGNSVSLWYDQWHLVGPLINHITPRDIYLAGMSLNDKTRLDKLCDFSTSGVWDDIRDFRDEDMLERWDVPCGSVCSLCNLVQESHNHLLIGCSYAKSIWRWFRGKAGLDGIIDRIEYGNDHWIDVINAMAGTVCNKGIWSIIRRLVFAAVIYQLWQERNARTFKNESSSYEVIAKRIYEVVRLRLMGLQVKKSMQSQSAAMVWHFSFVDGDGTHLSV
ncbi:uncharacterized protein [Rutidosis leptorrhynchoides]|uniref:uncharacterized protein n=1 Tax=Rutidosis leptorrhynchoides TaxID=125765 RepID=UPI003A997439